MEEDGTDTTERICRICQSCQDNEHLIRPCNCNGTMKYVHAFCLQNWIAFSSRLNCEVCLRGYGGRKTYKYGVLTSIFPYLRARWPHPKINIPLLFLYHLLEQVVLEAKDYYGGRGKYAENTSKFRLLVRIVFRWLSSTINPLRFPVVAMAYRDWSAWRRTQVIFVLDRKK